MAVSVADTVGKRCILHAQLAQGKLHNLSARGFEPQSPLTMAIGIVPVPLRGLPYGVDNDGGTERSKAMRVTGACMAPALVDGTAVVEDGVVEIE